jgi:signal peptidase I
VLNVPNNKGSSKNTLSQKAKHETWEWIKAIVIAILIVIPVKLFVLDTMIVPTGSMIPTIMPGDRLFVDQVSWHYNDLKLGDIIVFWTPFIDKSSLAMLGPFDQFMNDLSPDHVNGHVEYVKRLIGVGGDTIKLVPAPGHPYFYNVEVNGKIPNALKDRLYSKVGIFQNKDYYDELAHPQNYIGSPDYQFLLYYNQDMDYTAYYDSVYKKWGNYVTEDASGNITVHVPKGYFFAMGDNTTDSFDSRYWGFVPMGNMIGTPFLRIWPLNRFGVMK